MWMLSFVPEWLFYAIFLIGFAGILVSIFLKFIPQVYIFRSMIQTVSLVLMVLSSFFIGMKLDNNIWEARAEELSKKLEIAEQQSKEENIKIEEKIVTKTKVVREKADTIIQYVDKEIVKYDNQCVIPKEFIKAHNDSTEGGRK